MTPGHDANAQAAMYEALARHVWRRRGNRPAGQGLELHKRLAAPRGDGPAAGVTGLHDWLLVYAGTPTAPAVLDVGCGFGATVLHWAARCPGRYVGITPSPFQVLRAREQAAALRLADRCEFREQGLAALPVAAFDLVIAVESLCHLADWPAALAAIGTALRPGGTFVVVDDLRVDGTTARGFRRLAGAWHSPTLRTAAELRAAAAMVGLSATAVHDLTDQVPRRPRWWCRVAAAALSALANVTPTTSQRALLRAFAGGLQLENLYGRGLVRYLALTFRRQGTA
ncbi:MAG: class I SAM-dependent methyltransferase [Planctomycetes bacterium]|nr:class I SAM-dependent methyltransferase [Planctomycetota bacterium]